MNFVTITPENTVPTTGSDIIDLSINGKPVSCREVGSAMSSSWGKYLFASSYILVLIWAWNTACHTPLSLFTFTH
jgi:hypothetical protein